MGNQTVASSTRTHRACLKLTIDRQLDPRIPAMVQGQSEETTIIRTSTSSKILRRRSKVELQARTEVFNRGPTLPPAQLWSNTQELTSWTNRACQLLQGSCWTNQTTLQTTSTIKISRAQSKTLNNNRWITHSRTPLAFDQLPEMLNWDLRQPRETTKSTDTGKHSAKISAILGLLIMAPNKSRKVKATTTANNKIIIPIW